MKTKTFKIKKYNLAAADLIADLMIDAILHGIKINIKL